MVSARTHGGSGRSDARWPSSTAASIASLWPRGWSTAFAPEPSMVRLGVLHCDLHPDNVMVGPDGPVLIDWTRACAGDRAADLAQTWIIVADLGLPDNAVERRFEIAARRVLLRAFTGRVDRAEAQRWLTVIAADRLGDPHMTPYERTRLARYSTG
jgi:aminoglycoside phosphotransferase (APT) family kinase protein